MKKVQYLKIMAAAILGISGMFAPQPGTLTGEKLTATVYANGEDLSVFENSGKYIKKEDDGLTVWTRMVPRMSDAQFIILIILQ